MRREIPSSRFFRRQSGAGMSTGGYIGCDDEGEGWVEPGSGVRTMGMRRRRAWGKPRSPPGNLRLRALACNRSNTRLYHRTAYPSQTLSFRSSTFKQSFWSVFTWRTTTIASRVAAHRQAEVERVLSATSSKPHNHASLSISLNPIWTRTSAVVLFHYHRIRCILIRARIFHGLQDVMVC